MLPAAKRRAQSVVRGTFSGHDSWEVSVKYIGGKTWLGLYILEVGRGLNRNS